MILDIEEAASFLLMKKRTLYELASKGKVPATQIAGKWIFSKEQLQRFVEHLAENNLSIDTKSIETKTPAKSRRNLAY